ncbi:MAG TPA: hypothetical protein PLE80_07325 [Opitutaceae bacterium]|nr:hypothetical protein [Opitutaceae bacterium]
MPFVFGGCLNMPTPVSQITPTYVSEIKYENFDVQKLKIELDNLTQRESQLVVAQEQRWKTSRVQAFWWGYGQGDGIEASELARVRGEIQVVRKVLAQKEANPLSINTESGKGASK